MMNIKIWEALSEMMFIEAGQQRSREHRCIDVFFIRTAWLFSSAEIDLYSLPELSRTGWKETLMVTGQ